MNVLVVGSGGREHAIVKKLKEGTRVDKLYCAPGNGGISADAECVAIKATDVEGMTQFAKSHAIDFVVVAPDDPLVLGMVDSLNAVGVKTFGPNKAAAVIEGSKVFSKNLMKKYGIPTASYEVFASPDAAIDYIKINNTFPIVIKADGLALGKGVIIAVTLEEAVEGVHSIMEDKIFGASGNNVVIEEFITGPEVSVLAFVDGETVIPMISAMDHKRAYDNDQGPNTGGMGTVAPNRHYTDEIAAVCMDTIYRPTVDAMNAEERPFKGCLFFGLMLTEKGPYVIEYNCRFGDPETQVVLPLLKSDLLTIMLATYDGTLSSTEVQFEQGAAACVVLASGGYPKAYQTGKAIDGLNADGNLDGVTVYHAGTTLDGGCYKTAGGRVLGITAKGENLQQALANSYAAVKNIRFEGVHYRTDIGKK